MKISTRGRYALRMLLDLAEHRDDGYIPLKEVAQRQGISKNYLEQIMSLMKNTDLLKTTRGFQGGYKLTRSPDQYTVGEILRVTEGSIAPVSCLQSEINDCERSDSCMTLEIWKGLDEVISGYLDHITLQEVLDRYHSKNQKDIHHQSCI